MPHMDDHHCKHCHALIAFIPKAAIVGRFTLRCTLCGVKTAFYPVARAPQQVYTEQRQEATA